MKAFIAALIAIGIMSVIAALTLNIMSGSSESAHTSDSVRLD